jgi:CRP-like cAMP-binding protein
MTNLDLLGSTELFKGSSKEELELALGLFQERQVKPNTTIFTEKTAAEALFIVKSGSVRITITGGEGAEAGMLLLGPGEFFGELALLQEATRMVNARAETAADLLILMRKDFHALIDLDPRTGARVLMAIARLLAVRLRTYGDRLREFLLS